jgi:hypothetical protein
MKLTGALLTRSELIDPNLPEIGIRLMALAGATFFLLILLMLLWLKLKEVEDDKDRRKG